jgi:UDP-3-O-[3-hydroxymyristoyl] glucosamine N-acyltransferase
MVAYRLGELADSAGARLHGDPDILISGVGTLDTAKPGEISFLTNPKYRQFLAETKASAVILGLDDEVNCPTTALVSDNPYLAYAKVASQLFPEPENPTGCHASAVVATSAQIDPNAWIGPCAVIGENAQIGAGVFIGPGCVVSDDCILGEGTRLIARVTLCRGTWVGARCLIHPGAVLGTDGFGLANDAGRWVKVPQLGRVILGDDVEIGANTAIDRGALEDTVLEEGVKLDNLIHIAHNVQIGAHSALAAACAIAGSTKVGRYCTVGGLVGLAGHITIGDNVHFSGATPVTRSFKHAGYYSGNLPAMDNPDWRKAVARIRHLDEMAKRLKVLEKQVAAMQSDKE